MSSNRSLGSAVNEVVTASSETEQSHESGMTSPVKHTKARPPPLSADTLEDSVNEKQAEMLESGSVNQRDAAASSSRSTSPGTPSPVEHAKARPTPLSADVLEESVNMKHAGTSESGSVKQRDAAASSRSTSPGCPSTAVSSPCACFAEAMSLEPMYIPMDSTSVFGGQAYADRLDSVKKLEGPAVVELPSADKFPKQEKMLPPVLLCKPSMQPADALLWPFLLSTSPNQALQQRSFFSTEPKPSIGILPSVGSWEHFTH
jgi:hypothetical protein